MRTCLVILSTAVLWSGCCRVPRPATPGETADLVAALRAPALDMPVVRGELRVDHFGPEGRIAGKVYAFLAPGGRLRLEGVSPLDTPIRTVAVDGAAFSLVDQESSRCLQGEASPCLVGASVGLELSASHVAAALLGAVPLIRAASVSSRWNRCGYYEVTLTGEERGWSERIRLELTRGRLVATEATIAGPDGPVLELELGAWEPAGPGGRLVPRHLALRMPRSDADLRVEWREIEVGVSLPAAAWAAACPAGFPVETPTCQPRSGMPDLEPPGGVEPTPPDTTTPPDQGGPEPPPDPDDLSEELGI